jgi:peptide/nickel transport system substrate-binding protein
MISSKTLKSDKNSIPINIPPEITNELGIGANNIKIFAISNSVLKPDFYESSFMITKDKAELPKSVDVNIDVSENKTDLWYWIIPLGSVIGIIIIIKKRHHSKP